MREWYLGSMNDGLFIINAPPRPSTDDVWFDRPDGPSMIIAVSDMSAAKAQKIVDQHNAAIADPVPMVLHCPECRHRHIDEGAFATKPHHTHACQNCGMVWRPAIEATVGVQFLPGFKNEATA